MSTYLADYLKISTRSLLASLQVQVPLPCPTHCRVGCTNPHQDVVEVGLGPVDHVRLVPAAGLSNVARQWQDTDDGCTPALTQHVAEQAEPLSQEGLGRGLQAATQMVGTWGSFKRWDWHSKNAPLQ